MECINYKTKFILLFWVQ